MHGKATGVIAGTTALALALGGGIALADNVISDGDGVVATSTNSDWAVGSVCAGATDTRPVPVFINRNGNNTNTYKNGSQVSVRASSTGLTVDSDTKTITMPSDWATAANGTHSAAVSFTVGYTAPAELGAFSRTVTFTATGQNVNSAPLTRDDPLTVSGTVISCDSTGPVIVPSVSGTLGNNGWYTTDVDLSWSVTDAESAISSRTGCDAVSVTSDQVATTYTCSATSAGGTTSDSVNIKRDATAPLVDPGNVVNSTWRNTALSQSFTAADPISGLVTAADSAFTLTASAESADATTPTVASRTVTDKAGNSTTRTVAAKIDTTGPTVTYTSATGAQGDNDWYTSAVTAAFTAIDTLSGPASQSDTVGSGTAEGSAVTLSSPLFSDIAGNSASAGAASESFKIDLSNPTAAFDSAIGSVYYGSVPPAPACTASDGISGPAGCTVSGYSTAVGTHTLTATATDVAGRTGIATATYTVTPWTLRGFYSPVDLGAVWNTVKGGSTVPLKFEVFAGSELSSISAVQTFRQQQVTCPGGTAVSDAIEVTSTGGTSLRYDATGGQFIQNWQTQKRPGTCYTVTVTTLDGSVTSARFALK